MTNGINLAALGLGGIDTSSLVSSLVAVAAQPINQLGTEQQNIQSASSMISSFSSTLSALKNAATALSTPASFQAMSASSSDPSVVATTNTTNGTPAAGQWTVTVSSIAQAQRTLSNGTTDPTAGLGMGGQLTISVGSGASAKSATINLAGQSLNGIASEIAQSGLRVQASVVYTGSQYKLLISGLDTGAANTVSFDESQATFASGGFSLGWDAAHDPSYNANATIQQAQDASIRIGGTNGYTVTSPTNQITNAIPGVTLAVTQPGASATVTISSDASALEKNVSAFVTAYNAVVQNGHNTAGYGQQKAANSLLQGDNAIRSSLGQLEQLMAEQVPGTSGNYTTLASVGLSLNDDGTLSFDQTKFASALQADPSSVQRLFVTDSTNGSTGVMGAIGSAIDSLTDPASGLVTAEITSFSTQTQHMSKEITDMEQRLTDYQTQLQNEFTQMNAMLAKYKQIGAAINPNQNNGNNNGIFG